MPAALRETKRPVPQVVPARATGPQVQGRAGPGRSRRSETPQDGYYNGRACVFGTGPAVLLQAVRPRFLIAAFWWGWGQWRFATRLTRKRKPRPVPEEDAISPKQPAARRRRWRQAHFGQTGLKGRLFPRRPGIGRAFRAYSGSPGAPNWRGFFCPARQKTAGILAVLQGFLTQRDEKIPVKAACREILNRLLGWWSQNAPANCIGGLFWGERPYL